jgi:uncharacterized protein YmfQ (DUF2313 family)
MAVPPAFGTTDYAQAMARLLPTGRIWNRAPGAFFSNLLLALAPTYTRSTAAAAQVLVDGNPDTTENLLVEWEESLGLPDPCTPPNPTIVQRQAAVREKWGSRGGQSLAYFEALAGAAGITITIEEYAPFYTNRSRVGDRLWNASGASIWSVTFPDGADPEIVAPLMCVIEANKPAHTQIIWLNLPPPETTWDDGQTTWDDGQTIWD